ncbi:hypothetical protein C3L33_22931, partial [Rhododendron williamsianum]
FNVPLQIQEPTAEEMSRRNIPRPVISTKTANPARGRSAPDQQQQQKEKRQKLSEDIPPPNVSQSAPSEVDISIRLEMMINGEKKGEGQKLPLLFSKGNPYSGYEFLVGFSARLEMVFSGGSRAVRMSTPARKRLMRDFKRLQQDPPAGISGAPQDNNIMLWNAVIFGPDDTPWDGGKVCLFLNIVLNPVYYIVPGYNEAYCCKFDINLVNLLTSVLMSSVILFLTPGTFKLTLQFSEDYPNKPPTVRFVSRMFHPNSMYTLLLFLELWQFMQMEAFVWIFYKISGVLSMMWLLYLPPSSFSLSFLLEPFEESFVLLDETSVALDLSHLTLGLHPRIWVDCPENPPELSLLCDPNPNSPANSEAARMFSENKREYNRRVREIVEQSWTAD